MRVNFPDVSVSGEIVEEEQVVTDETRSLFVGGTERGPAFVKTPVGTVDQLHRIYGTESPVVKAAEKQIEAGGVPRIQRVMDSKSENPDTIELTDSSGDTLLVWIYRGEVENRTVGASGDVTNFTLTIESDPPGTVFEEVNLSLNDQLEGYVEREDVEDFELYLFFPEKLEDLEVGEPVSASFRKGLDLSSLSPSRPKTPWITSGDFNENFQRERLFRFVLNSEGTDENRRVKVSISEINEQEGTFTVEVRDFEDSDFNPTVLERFELLSLNDEDSENYIAEEIGDKYSFFSGGRIATTGRYEGRSNYVSVEIAQTAFPSGVVPKGFEGYKTPYAPSQALPDPVYRTTQSLGDISDYVDFPLSERDDLFLGFDANVEDNIQYLKPIPNGALSSPDFNLEDATDVVEEKFTVAFQGGYDGQILEDEKRAGIDATSNNLYGITKLSTFETAFEILNQDFTLDVELLVVPDCLLDVHTNLCNSAEAFARDTGTVLFVAGYLPPIEDFSSLEDPKEVLTSSYVSVYHGWANVEDKAYPISNFIPTGYSKHDNSVGISTAPAGDSTNLTVEDLERNYYRNEEEQFLQNGINFVSDNRLGIVLQGNRTLLFGDGPKTKLKVRRGLNKVKNEVSQRGRELLFENVNEDLTSEYRDFIEDTLSGFQNNGLLQDYTFDLTAQPEQNRISVAGQLQFTGTNEFVDVNFDLVREVDVFV
jgi:hypothetical protein